MTYKVKRTSDTESLSHHGILGQKWGVRRYQNPDGTLTDVGKRRYRSDGIKSFYARKKNEAVDKSFLRWEQESKKRQAAIDIGKKRNIKMIELENDSRNKQTKKEYDLLNKEFKKATSRNTTYRKGDVRSEVNKDLSRKYLSEAKKVSKLLDKDPNNKALKKKYSDLMNKHDVYRYKGRRDKTVGAARSTKKHM